MNRRHITIACAFLGVGVVLNVAVALSCVIAAQRWPPPVQPGNSVHVRHWPAAFRAPEDVEKGALDLYGRRLDARGYSEQSLVTLGHQTPRGDIFNVHLHVIEAGWPARALQRRSFRFTDGDEDDDVILDDSYELLALMQSFYRQPNVPSGNADHFILPLQPH